MALVENHGLHIELWNRYETGVRRLCEYKLKSNPNDIEDVVSETFLILCKAIEDEVEIKNYGGWIYAVANNLIKQLYEKNNDEKEILVSFSESDEEFYDIKVGYDLEDKLISDEEIEELKEEIINSLSPSEKTIIRLFHEEKIKMKEIAEVLNISESAVKQKHYRTVRKIKKAVKELLGES